MSCPTLSDIHKLADDCSSSAKTLIYNCDKPNSLHFCGVDNVTFCMATDVTGISKIVGELHIW